jgi:glucose/arabinose dehydrogenase
MVIAAGVAGSALAGSPATPQFVQLIPNSAGVITPIGIYNAGDGSGRVFINERGGQIRVLRNNALLGPNYADLSIAADPLECTFPGAASQVTVGFTGGGEQGLLGLAFHPSFETNGQVFVSISDGRGDTMIVRFTMANPAADAMTAADRQTCTVILRADQPFSNHNGGNIDFGPDGLLYFGLGDGGSAGDPCNNAQTLAPADLLVTGNCAPSANYSSFQAGDPRSRALMGKFLRIDTDGSTPAPTSGADPLCGRPSVGQAAPYAIPSGQPGASGAIAAACDEVWSYGWRNPWRYSFDRNTGELIVGDVGQGSIEEVSIEPASTGGRNYGWKCFEGNSVNASCPNLVVPHTPPIITYTHVSGRCSMTGGFRYRGTVNDVAGQIFYGDLCSREVWGSSFNGTSWTQPGTPFQPALPAALTAFGEDEAGDLYLAIAGSTGFGGSVDEIWVLDGPRGQPDALFQNGFE